ncbi:two-component system, OmpR family, KDP operon response regulator KdpE [Azotobacter beijerinckii]|uniref:Two-component system, OmpR family, KDP operon response regulator KdpE n=1 Tax=Azotobacter beijerinckii TaxID=170623 RepID=A0A1H9S6B8_9GAMM|nr:response regulator [Azotobacter beijerinckii]SER80520.1 two-component system, OmpR family, KDP operon response regulator KdpE [Azotobacter beijerinckii]
MSETPTILLVEDDPQIRELVAATLEGEGYAIVEAGTAVQGAVEAGACKPDLLILDLGLPDRNGINFIRDYRIWSAVPILVLSARSQEISKVTALDAGADDYLTKPFGVSELLARVRALLRRPAAEREQLEPTIEFGDCRIDCVRRQVTRAGEPLHLTDIQYRLLILLASNPGRVLTHRQLLLQIWGGRAVENNQYLRVYVGHLRQKIERIPAQPQHILTEIGVGYRFQP